MYESEATKNEKETKKDMLPEENPRVQRVLRLQEQAKRDREAEDILLEKMLAEQRMVDKLNISVEDNLQRTKEARKYQKELEESITSRIYCMHGISEDKLEGIREYKNAYDKGCTFSLFLLSIVLVILCGVLHTFQSDICIFMAFFTAIEGALLASENKRGKILAVVCKISYLLLFPAMMTIFVCYELHYPEYHILLPVFTIAGMVILVIGVSSYFIYDPYLEDKRKIRHAESRIREIEREAQKEVKKNQKVRANEEKKQLKVSLKQEKKQQKFTEKQKKREDTRRRRLEKKRQRKEKGTWFWRKKGTEALKTEALETEALETEALDTKALEKETLRAEVVHGESLETKPFEVSEAVQEIPEISEHGDSVPIFGRTEENLAEKEAAVMKEDGSE